jgi:broad specificity phosphatase PhoE
MRFIRWAVIFVLIITINPYHLSTAATATGESRGWDIYFVRHAETVANKTGDYSGDNARRFTPEGEAAILDLINKLAPYHFDHIIVSPLFRTRATILPYLQHNGLKAEIWPELAECCWQQDKGAPVPETIRQGEEIVLEPEHVPFFTFRDENATRYIDDRSYAEGLAQIKRSYELLKERYSGSGESVLIIGHSLAGIRLLDEIIGEQQYTGSTWLDNATINHVRVLPDGTVKVLMINDVEQTREVTVSST